MNRAARSQEGLTVRQAQEMNSGRQDRLHAQMMRLKMTEERLKRLADSVASPHYVTTKDDLEKMKTLHQEGELKEMGDNALALFFQLQPPGTGEDGVDQNEASRRALVRIKEIFGLNSDVPPQPRRAPGWSPPPNGPSPAGPAPAPPPAAVAAPPAKGPQYPNITPAEWQARERPRQLLENLLTRMMDSCREQCNALLKESVQGPSPYERAAEIAPTQPSALLMRRMQDSQLREVRRLANLLMKIKRYERRKVAIVEDENKCLREPDPMGDAG